MEATVGRRVFVGSVVAGLPLLATVGSRAFAQAGGAAAHAHGDGAVADPVMEHIAREMAKIHNAMRTNPRGEHARAFAVQLRTMAVYGRQIDLDAKVRSAIRSRIDAEGRDAVLYTDPPDAAQMVKDLKRYGADADVRVLERPVYVDYARRNSVLDGLLRSGMTDAWERAAGTFDRIGLAIDRRAAVPGTSIVVRVARQDAEYWEAYCNDLYDQVMTLSRLVAEALALTKLPLVGEFFVPGYIGVLGGFAVLAGTYGWYC
jgi:hypothetical protein